MCGKNDATWLNFDNVSGSPPRVREKLIPKKPETLEDRITPACAGKTRLNARTSSQYRDHPRVCGKNLNGDIIAMPYPGSPPRVREKL